MAIRITIKCLQKSRERGKQLREVGLRLQLPHFIRHKLHNNIMHSTLTMRIEKYVVIKMQFNTNKLTI